MPWSPQILHRSQSTLNIYHRIVTLPRALCFRKHRPMPRGCEARVSRCAEVSAVRCVPGSQAGTRVCEGFLVRRGWFLGVLLLCFNVGSPKSRNTAHAPDELLHPSFDNTVQLHALERCARPKRGLRWFSTNAGHETSSCASTRVQCLQLRYLR